jgi:hypothetical protein
MAAEGERTGGGGGGQRGKLVVEGERSKAMAAAEVKQSKLMLRGRAESGDGGGVRWWRWRASGVR